LRVSLGRTLLKKRVPKEAKKPIAKPMKKALWFLKVRKSLNIRQNYTPAFARKSKNSLSLSPFLEIYLLLFQLRFKDFNSFLFRKKLLGKAKARNGENVVVN
jgi:hypothetical protein